MGNTDRANLLQETIEFLWERNLSPADVLYVMSAGGEQVGVWEDFVRLADEEYHSGYGGHEVNLALLIVGDGWWLERWEYDGSEGWRMVQPPQKPTEARLLNAGGVWLKYDWEESEEGNYTDDYPPDDEDEEEDEDPLYRLRFSDAGSYTTPWLVDKHPLDD